MIQSLFNRSLAKAAVLVASTALAFAFVATPAQAASISYTDTGCAAFTVTGTAPNFTLNCAKLACSIASSAGVNISPVTSGTTLTASCVPAATTNNWVIPGGSNPPGCPVLGANGNPTMVLAAPGAVASGCNYEVDSSNGTLNGSAQITLGWSNIAPSPPSGCTATANPATLPAGGGTTQLSVTCSGGGAPTSYFWVPALPGMQQMTTSNTQPATLSSTISFSITASNAAGNGNVAVVSVTVGGGGGGGGSLANCTSQGFTVLPSTGINATWALPGSWPSASSGNFGDNTVWLFIITPPAGTPVGNLGRFTLTEFGGPITPRQLTISTTPCDFRPKDPTGATGPLAVSNGTSTELYYGIGSPQVFGNIAYMTAGTTYYVSARNWELDPAPASSCGQPTCNALMNDQPATP